MLALASIDVLIFLFMNALTQQLLTLFHSHPSVSTDTRKVQPGDLFFALKGDRFDGNRFATQALESGAAYVVIDDPAYHHPEDARYLLAEDALQALQDLARAYRREFDIPVFGLTGSNGKTTTKELIHAALSTERRTYATAGNFNNHIGVPLTLLAMPRDTEVAVIEMGANQPGDIAELAAIAEPTHGLITNVGAAHLERLGDLDGVQRTKGALFDFIETRAGTIFLNEADPRVVKAAANLPQRITYGTETSDFHYRLLENRPGVMRIEVRCDAWLEPQVFVSSLSGEYNCMNLVAAIAVGSYFGISVAGLKQGIAGYLPSNNRSEVLKKGDKTLWLDAYNANPTSMHAAISNLFAGPTTQVALILGDMFELGEESESLHAALGDFINEFQPAMTIGVGPMMQATVKRVSTPKAWFVDVDAAKAELPGLLQGVELVLIKGSRGMALERLVEAI